ncbi:MAG TPA: prephenate dehydratase [Firmicutes bacterium]|nr:prephenate dehydratase [Bacillota bacterium]
MDIGYFGPAGTFTYQAAKKFAQYHQAKTLTAYPSIIEVLRAVEEGKVDRGIVPFENSTEGTVTFTVDALIFDVDVTIAADLVLPIRHSLAARPGTKKEEVTRILSHPQALAQCRKYLQANFPMADQVPFGSTAASAVEVAQKEEPWACICTEEAAELAGLTLLDQDVQDENGNETRFLVVAPKGSVLPEYEGRTSLAFGTGNRPGDLYKILDIIAIWDLNMTKIESRPRKDHLGKYVFFIDIESANAADLRDALKMIERKTMFFHYFGTYNTIRL